MAKIILNKTRSVLLFVTMMFLVLAYLTPARVQAQEPEEGYGIAAEPFSLPNKGNFWGSTWCTFYGSETAKSVDLFTVPAGKKVDLSTFALNLTYGSNEINAGVNIALDIGSTRIAGGQVNEISPWFYHAGKHTLRVSAGKTLTLWCWRESGSSGLESVRITYSGRVGNVK